MGGCRACLFRHAQDAEDFLELRAHRQIERLAGRQALQEPFVVELDELAALPARRAKVRSTTAAKSGIVACGTSAHRDRRRDIRRRHYVVAPTWLGGDEAVEQHVVGGEGVGLAGLQHRETIAAWSRADDDVDAELLLVGDARAAPPRWWCRQSRPRSCRRGRDRTRCPSRAAPSAWCRRRR